VRTVVLEAILDILATLGLLVVVRTFLSWSVVVEIEGLADHFRIHHRQVLRVRAERPPGRAARHRTARARDDADLFRSAVPTLTANVVAGLFSVLGLLAFVAVLFRL
jgi:hypothetical protein